MPLRPVLLIHGIQAGPSTWWRVGADLTALGFDVTMPTVPGNAGTPMTEEGTLGSLADAIAPAEPALVVGHSLGALVAMELAARRPDLVLGLVLEDPPARGAVDPAELAEEIRRDAAEARADPDGLLGRLLAQNPLWAHTDASNAVGNRAAMDDFGAVTPLQRAAWDVVAMVQAAACPVSVLAATVARSALGGPERAPFLAAADRAVVVESGHGVHRDRPGVWVAVVAEAAARAFGSATARPGA